MANPVGLQAALPTTEDLQLQLTTLSRTWASAHDCCVAKSDIMGLCAYFNPKVSIQTSSEHPD